MNWTYYQSSLYLTFHQLWPLAQDQASGVFDSRSDWLKEINQRTHREKQRDPWHWLNVMTEYVPRWNTNLGLAELRWYQPTLYQAGTPNRSPLLYAMSYQIIEGDWRTWYHESLESCSCLTYQYICLQLDTVMLSVFWEVQWRVSYVSLHRKSVLLDLLRLNKGWLASYIWWQFWQFLLHPQSIEERQQQCEPPLIIDKHGQRRITGRRKRNGSPSWWISGE